MLYQSLFRWFPLFLLMAALMNAGCSIPVVNRPALSQPATQAPAPTPMVTLEKGGVDDPNVFIDPDPFKAALPRP